MNTPKDLPLILLPERIAVSRLASNAEQPDWARPGQMLAFLQTPDELTVVCSERFVPPEINAERGWRLFKVQGPLDFGLVGVIAAISEPLYLAGVSIFVLSTFETDYFLVKEDVLDRAVQALVQEGFLVIHDVSLSA